jgi:hypothetical protein
MVRGIQRVADQHRVGPVGVERAVGLVGQVIVARIDAPLCKGSAASNFIDCGETSIFKTKKPGDAKEAEPGCGFPL